jgi:hypothetical protein
MQSKCLSTRLFYHWQTSSRKHYGSTTTVPFDFVSYTPVDFTPTGSLPTLSQVSVNARALEAERKSALNRLNLAINAVEDLERRMGLTERWTPAHEEYQKADEYLKNHRFIRAVEALEGLVVQRLFELSKANLSGTGVLILPLHLLLFLIPF